jgi:hypothetical protein
MDHFGIYAEHYAYVINPKPLLTFVILWLNVTRGEKHVLRTIGS